MMSETSHRDERLPASFRQRNLRRLQNLSGKAVVVLGGGVNGTAVVRDLALNGVPSVLLETGDFCQGASSASTRLAHGGLRYLEQREFGLVRQSVEERNRLLTHAPHAVEALPIAIPLEQLIGGAIGATSNFLGLGYRRAPLNLVTLKAALTLYEFFSRHNAHMPKHRVRLGRNHLPNGINQAFRAVANYHDGKLTHPEGLILEMLSEACALPTPAVALNHVSWEWNNGTIVVKDNDSGSTATVTPKLIINATGASVDWVNTRLSHGTNYVMSVRGSHIVVDHAELHSRMNGTAFYYDDGDGRMVIACPLDRTVLMGTTEIVGDHQLMDTIDQAELDYLLASLNRLFPSLSIGTENIVASTTGTRPMRSSSRDDPYSASRDHKVVFDDSNETSNTPPIISLIGGKWTTFRAFAEEVTDVAMERLGRRRTVSTRDRGYLGTPSADTPKPTDKRQRRLRSRYGALWSEIAHFCAEDADRMLSHAPGYSQREVVWLVQNRAVVRLDDLVLRRTTLALDGHGNEAMLNELSKILSDTLGRGPGWARDEVENCLRLPSITMRNFTFEK